jgi:hypothetical protein
MKRSIKVLEIFFWIIATTLLIGLAYTGEAHETTKRREIAAQN